MEIFIILTILLHVPFIVFYLAYKFKKNGTNYPLRNKLRIIILLFNLALFIACIISICTFSENRSDLWIMLSIVSVLFSTLTFLFYIKELLELKWKKLDQVAAKIEMWNSKSLLREDFDRYNNVIFIGSDKFYNGYINGWKLEPGDGKLKFIHEGFERKGSPKLIGLVAFHVMHFNTIDLYDATSKGEKAKVIEEMFNKLNTYFDLEVFKDNKTLKNSDNMAKYFSKETKEDIKKYIDQYKNLK